jgi:fructokinase
MPATILGVGELLWDLLPAGPRPGGAPFNFAFHCYQLGHPASIVSRVGTDSLGNGLRGAVRALGLLGTHVQDDPSHPTGTVAVTVGADGQPTYRIEPEVAWDYLAWQPELESLAVTAEAVCFGTLAQRHPVARETIRRLLRTARNALIIYDVNLRQDHYDRACVEASLTSARWVKLNDEELVVLRDLFGLSGSPPQLLAELRRCYGIELICLTRGATGCLLQTADEQVVAPGQKVDIVDTVGAGDAFTAGLLAAVLEGKDLAAAAAFANRLAARVAAAPGGTPTINRADID